MASSSSDTPFITLEKSMTFRGGREHWVNTYHIDIQPQTETEWLALGQLIWSYEAGFLTSDVHIEKYYGHSPGSPPVLVWEYDSPPPGEGGAGGAYTPTANDVDQAGDTAMWIRYGTTQKNSRGKPIYLRNYYHDAHGVLGPVDEVSAGQQTAMNAFGAAFVAGLSSQGKIYRRCGPRGAVAQNHAVSPFLTTRTLKHRGRRHRWSPGSAPQGYRWILTNVPEAIN